MTRQAIIALRCLILASIGPGFSGSACHAAPTNPLHWNKGRGYAPFSHATPDGLRIVSNTDAPIADSCRLQTSPESFVLSFRAAARSSWGVFLSPDSGDKIWLTLAFEEIPDMLSSAPALTVKASRGSDGKILAEKKIREGVDLAGGKNVWRISSERGRISLLAGHRGLVPVFSFPVSGNSLSSFGFAVAPQGCLEIDNISLIPSVGRPAPFHASSPEEIEDSINHADDPLLGHWTVFDRSLDEELLRLGGDYRVAIVDDGENYVMIYEGGAKVNASEWKKGMRKAVLTPSLFQGIYSVVWTDAEGKEISHDIKAQIDPEDTLSIQFPYHSSVVRLRKIQHR